MIVDRGLSWRRRPHLRSAKCPNQHLRRRVSVGNLNLRHYACILLLTNLASSLPLFHHPASSPSPFLSLSTPSPSRSPLHPPLFPPSFPDTFDLIIFPPHLALSNFHSSFFVQPAPRSLLGWYPPRGRRRLRPVASCTSDHGTSNLGVEASQHALVRAGMGGISFVGEALGVPWGISVPSCNRPRMRVEPSGRSRCEA